jgi:hypothetical protein
MQNQYFQSRALGLFCFSHVCSIWFVNKTMEILAASLRHLIKCNFWSMYICVSIAKTIRLGVPPRTIKTLCSLLSQGLRVVINVFFSLFHISVTYLWLADPNIQENIDSPQNYSHNIYKDEGTVFNHQAIQQTNCCTGKKSNQFVKCIISKSTNIQRICNLQNSLFYKQRLLAHDYIQNLFTYGIYKISLLTCQRHCTSYMNNNHMKMYTHKMLIFNVFTYHNALTRNKRNGTFLVFLVWYILRHDGL